MSSKFTEFERQALEARRRGNHVEVEQGSPREGKAPVVSLREFTETVQSPPPGPAPMPLPDVPGEMPQMPQAPQVSSVAAAPASDTTLEQMKDAMFGKVQSENEETEPEEVEEPEDDDATDPLRELRAKHCPRCGWLVDDVEFAEPTDEDKLEFVESVLASRRFEKEVSRLGGKVRMRFRTVTVPEEDAITEHLNGKIAGGLIQNSEEWTLEYQRARLVCMLSEVILGGEHKKYPMLKESLHADEKELVAGLSRLVRELPAEWPTSVYGMAVQCMKEMDDTYTHLMSRAYDPNFWKGQTDK